MVSRDCKRLAEVDFPIAEVSKHAAREKSIRHGHPSTLHLWWARRPLASSRAVLMALLLPDPCDEHCPEAFKKKARRLLLRVANCDPGTTDETLRKALLRFIGDFANWDLAANRTYLDVSRAMVKAARNALRADHRCVEGRGPAQRDRWGGLYRPTLAARIQGDRFLAPHQPASKLPEWIAYTADRSGLDPSPQDR